MAQVNDLTINDDNGLAVLEQMNSTFAAALSNNSGPTAPPATLPGMPWVDTAGGATVLKVRNAADSAWLQVPTGVVDHNTAAWEAGTATEPGIPSPADVSAAIAAQTVFSKSYESAAQTITLSGALTLAHGLSTTPILTVMELRCTTAEGGYSIGDRVIWPLGFGETNSATTSWGASVVPDATNLNIRFSANGFAIINKSTGNYFSITPGNWRAVWRAFA